MAENATHNEQCDSPFLTTRQAATYLLVVEGTLKNWRSKGTCGPVWRKHGAIVCYHRNDLDTWSLSRAQGAGDERE